MECLNGIVESIVFKSDDTGYVVSKVRIDKDCINAVGIVPFLKEGQHGFFISNLDVSLI